MPLRTLGARLSSLDIRSIKQEPKRAEPFYLSAEWRALLASIIKERGRRCEDPAHDPRKPRSGVMIYGDHIVELKDGGAPLEKSNIMLRCPSCHSHKTIAERSRRLTPLTPRGGG